MSTTFTPPALLHIDTRCPPGGTAHVALIGEIDLSNADGLRASLLEVLFARHPDRIEVDLAGVTFMSCGGLSALVGVGNVATRTACQLRIKYPQPVVRRVLELTGLLGVLTAGYDQVRPRN
ncbi:STAS domain-containing protein [Paractinoplanes rishiriensis]|uniref:Anti-sigma factor antagonist n=1 Tax=Paractinoplanes rishiriensis TaxID=1050105 RepID=A0A919K8F2_9ACTN|nr:STAS domain-containing protein [Actinoplanes rishiriensis]GIF01298.1 hypothetical protein Ari01nite_87620 [Actinoplanes rishiriensis]